MYCKKCGRILPEGANVCLYCGAASTAADSVYCQMCGEKLDPGAKFCTKCGAGVNGANAAGKAPCSKMAAGLLGIFLGGFGVHSFYLGDTTKGIIQIVVTVFTCGAGSLWGFIEGIMILAGSIKTDASGRPLTD